MAVFKCKMCGGTIDFNPGESVGICEFCGTKQTLPKTNDEVIANLFNRANNLRLKCEFDKAEQIYEKIVQQDDSEAEAHWGIILCKYGIEYVEDPKTFERVPTCHRTRFESIRTDADYEAAVDYADTLQQSIYEKEAREIDKLQKDILAIVKNEKPFDVFICYKETDDSGKRTIDSTLANDIYHQLTLNGLKVFYAAITLEDKLGQEYEPYIFAALNSAKVMLAIGTKPEYYTSVWVKNEWSRFMNLMKTDKSKILIPCYRDMDAYDLPEEFAHLQAQDMSKIGFIQDIIRGVEKVVGKDAKTSSAAGVASMAATAMNTAPLLKRAFMFLEDGSWRDADSYCEKVLDQDPENAQAYLGKLMAEYRVKTQSDLADLDKTFSGSNNYRKAIRFGDDELISELNAYLKTIDERINKQAGIARTQGLYNSAKIIIESEKDRPVSDYEHAIALLGSISGFMDADILVEKALKKIEEAKQKAKRKTEIKEALEEEYRELEQIIDTEKRKNESEIDKLKNKKREIQNNQINKLDEQIQSLLKSKNALAFFEFKKKESINEEILKLEKEKENCNSQLSQIDEQIAALKASSEQELRTAFSRRDSIDYMLKTGKLTRKEEQRFFGQSETPTKELIDTAAGQGVKLPFSVRAESGRTFGIKSDGSVVAAGNNLQGQCNVSNWTNVVSVICCGFDTIGLRSDGTVMAIGWNQDGQCDVSDWTDIIAIASGGPYTIGLRSDGTVVAAGNNDTIPCNVSSWRDVIAVAAEYSHTIGLQSDGTVVATGDNKYGQCNVSDWVDIAAIYSGSGRTIGLRSDGTVVATGDNKYGQCDVSEWTDIITISACDRHTVGLRSDGTVVAAGKNDQGQCDVSDWTDIIAIATGTEHTIGLRSDGTVVATGDNKFGQCNVSDWHDIAAIYSGRTNTIGLRADGTAVAVGWNMQEELNITDWKLLV